MFYKHGYDHNVAEKSLHFHTSHASNTNFRDSFRIREDHMRPISEYFGENVFSLEQMREKLPRNAYQELLRSLEQGKKIGSETANEIAQVVREWAVSKGCTHFCHWFQPMTGLTAEKHDAFISIQHANHSELKVIERFSGSQLIQGEPDASSFPSGGMRSTFEARGYTAWDPTSPIFIVEGGTSRTLYIPSVFFGYHGQALDNKTPLLRSNQAISQAACEFLKLLGDVDVKAVIATLGAEQEYFLVDKSYVAKRPDLIMTGRTLIGAAATRGQRLEDHYFGAIPQRVQTFMEDLEHELYKLGIPIKTRHNEVAPSQFEMAPIFENLSIATDHNTLAMEIMRRVALRHGFVCLLHEKPFAGINGSGKHCNWSVSNDKGENLLDPGKTPHQNLRFLAMCAVVIKAVHRHSDVLRASITSPGNDHRLGGNEAPPAIISIFLGSLLENIFNSIDKGEAAQGTDAQILNLGVSHIPDISRDYTDRNRTSPFAFTGNKFEFRAVGSSSHVAVPMTILNAAVTETLLESTKRLKTLLSEVPSRDEAVMRLIRELIQESKQVLFSGNNYSEEWRAEAAKRGLPVLNSSAEALKVYACKEATKFLVNTNVLSAEEVQSRYHIGVERYVNTLEIEFGTLTEIVSEYVLPALEKQLIQSHSVLKNLSKSGAASYKERISKMEAALDAVVTHNNSLEQAMVTLSEEEDHIKKMDFIANSVSPTARALRNACDSAELLIADEYWLLPRYREMLFANVVS